MAEQIHYLQTSMTILQIYAHFVSLLVLGSMGWALWERRKRTMAEQDLALSHDYDNTQLVRRTEYLNAVIDLQPEVFMPVLSKLMTETNVLWYYVDKSDPHNRAIRSLVEAGILSKVGPLYEPYSADGEERMVIRQGAAISEDFYPIVHSIYTAELRHRENDSQ